MVHRVNNLVLFFSMLDLAGDDSDDEDDNALALKLRKEALKSKFRAVGKLARSLRTLRDESETVEQLKSLAGGSLPAGALAEGKTSIQASLRHYMRKHKAKSWDEARLADMVNERLPPSENSGNSSLQRTKSWNNIA